MLSTLLILALMGTPAAFAADLPSTCGTSGTDLCVDVDVDGFFTEPGASTTPAEADCDDADARVYPKARLVLGDAKDSDCNGTGDDDERDEAIAAAREIAAKKADPKDVASPKAVAAADAVEETFGAELDRCLTGGGFVNDDSVGVWGWDKPSSKVPTCIELGDGLTYQRGRNGVGYITPADRAALGVARSATAKADALAATLGTPGTSAVPATADTPAIEAVAPTGLYLELAELEAAMVAADAETRAQLAAAKTALEERIGKAESSIVSLKSRMGAVEGRLEVEESSGIVLEGGLSGFVLAGRGLYEYENGPMVRSGTAGGVVGSVTIGSAWFGHVLYLDLGFGQGSEASGDVELPVTVGSAAFGHQWVVGDGSLAIGPQLLLVGEAMGNPLDSTVSGWGGGAGMKFSYLIPLENGNTRVGIHCGVTGVVERFGTNDVWDTGPAFYGTCGIAGGRGPLR